MTDLLKPPRARASDSPSKDDVLKRFLKPNEVIGRPPATTAPHPGNDPKREAAMNFVRQMRIYAR
jgi:hypothetical protein